MRESSPGRYSRRLYRPTPCPRRETAWSCPSTARSWRKPSGSGRSSGYTTRSELRGMWAALMKRPKGKRVWTLSPSIRCRPRRGNRIGEDAGHDDEAEHHRQQQVEQVVSRVERSDPDREGQQQEPHALRRQAQGPVAVEPAEELADAFEPHWAYSGTGTDSTTSWMTRSASSERCPREPWLVFSITRCARTIGANSLMSSGRQ